jgi:hypothetical protein
MSVKTTSKTNFDEIKEALKELTLEDVRPIALSLIEFMKNFGEFVIGIGHLQKKSEKASEIIFRIGEEPEAFLALLIDKIPEDRLKTLIELSLKLSALQTSLQKYKSLSAEEKVHLGEEFKETAEEMANMFRDVKK